VQLCRDDGAAWFLAASLRRLAGVHIAQRQLALAEAELGESLTISRRLGESAGLAYTLEGFATLAAAGRAWRPALRLAGAAGALRERVGRLVSEQLMLDRTLEPARLALGEAEATTAWLQGQAMDLEHALDYALDYRKEPPRSAFDLASVVKRAIPLTSREQDVTRLVAAGQRNRQIAELLCIAEGTAKRHIENILTKLGLESRTQLAAWAVANEPVAALSDEARSNEPAGWRAFSSK
jgi:DNA-binding CsgD family transcriptional regulator